MIERPPNRTADFPPAPPHGPTPAQGSRQRLRQLAHLTHALTRNPALDDALPLIARSAARIIGSERAALLLLERDGRLTLRASVGLETPPADITIHLDDQLQSQVEHLLGGPAYVTLLTAHDQPLGVLAVTRPDGRSEEDQWLLSVIADHAAIAVAYAVEVEGQTEHLQLQIAQTLSDAERRQMLMSTLAHDLRSPLLTIRMGTQLVEKALPADDKDNRDVLRHMRVAAQYLEIMAQNLLEMGRLAAGAVRVNPRQHALEPIIEGAMATVEATSSGRIHADVPPRTGAFADPDRLRQVMVNLLSNAIKYSPADSPVQVEVTTAGRRPDRRVIIRVTDRGTGIAPEHHEAIFRPYFRLDDSGYTKAGAGLGLSLARELVRRMDGDLTVQSELGKGATFTVDLPAEDPEAE